MNFEELPHCVSLVVLHDHSFLLIS